MNLARSSFPHVRSCGNGRHGSTVRRAAYSFAGQNARSLSGNRYMSTEARSQLAKQAAVAAMVARLGNALSATILDYATKIAARRQP